MIYVLLVLISAAIGYFLGKPIVEVPKLSDGAPMYPSWEEVHNLTHRIETMKEYERFRTSWIVSALEHAESELDVDPWSDFYQDEALLMAKIDDAKRQLEHIRENIS
jgi:hypothetical protein